VIEQQLSNAIQQVISDGIATKDVKITQARMLTGGDISEAFYVKTNAGDFFVKWNNLHKYPGIFEAEANGLKSLAAVGSLHVPKVVGHGTSGDRAFLVLEFVETQRKQPDFWEVFGKGLARIHQTTHGSFGWEISNYIGSLKQTNTWFENFPSFYVDKRLEPMVKMGFEKNRLSQEDVAQFEKLYHRIDHLVPQEAPSLLHGDLWGGNYLVDAEGHPCLIDPACYYGHREADIAMMRLFGGFSHDVFHHYNLAFPMESGWQDRLPFFNLYPLLVHVNLFGGSYVQQLRDNLKKIK
jgi:protein-ribulosamine 3-kinase